MRTLSLFFLLTVAMNAQRFTSVFVDIPKPNSPVIGVLTVSGWAIDNTDSIGSAITLVQVGLDGTSRVVAQYGVYRPDVCNVYPGRPGCPYVGFTAQLDTSIVPPGNHTLNVWATNSTNNSGQTNVPIMVAASFSDHSTMSTGAEVSGGTVIDGFTGLPTALPTASNPIPQLSLVTSQQNAPFTNRLLTLSDSYTKTIQFAPPNSPVYMLGAQYANPTAPPYNFCLTPSSYFASGSPCQVGVTDGNGNFSVSGSLAVWSISAPFPPQQIAEDWYVGGVADSNWVGSLGYSLFDLPPVSANGVALMGVASQSSLWMGGVYGGEPWRASDCNRDGAYNNGSVSTTDYDANAWWQTDLGVSASVASVTVWNRTDGDSNCCANRLNDFWVFVSNTPFQPSDTPASLLNAGVWGSHITQIPSPNVVVPVGIQGRYVRVQLSGTNYLTLAEVQVYGTLPQ